MNIKRNLTLLALSALSTGCVIAPVVDSHQPYASQCVMQTKRMTLDKPAQSRTIGCHQTSRGSDFLSCLVVMGVIAPAGSLIISGSIVLVNNSLHWLEYQGKCDKKTLDEKAEQVKEQADTT